MRRVLALVSMLVLMLALAPPATARDPDPDARVAQLQGPRIGLVTNGAALTDLGFTYYAWAGAQAGAKVVHGSAEAIVPRPP
jgi:hypothetical protein